MKNWNGIAGVIFIALAMLLGGCGGDDLADNLNEWGEDVGKEMAFNFTDADKDELLSAEEWENGNYVSDFADVDTNGDGALDLDEYKAADTTQNQNTGNEAAETGAEVGGEFGTEVGTEVGSEDGTEVGSEESACVPDCLDKQCGDDGCGSVCALCAPGLICTESFQCEQESTGCIADCAGKSCGDDGCGGSCGACAGGTNCNASTGQCEGGNTNLVEGDCNSFITCIQACGEEDTACQEACASADPNAAQATLNLVNCQQANCGECAADDQACLTQCSSEFCGAEVAACFPATAGSCLDVLICTNSCADQTCVDACLAAGSTTGAQLYTALYDCLMGACAASSDPAGCIATAQAAGGECYDANVACNQDG